MGREPPGIGKERAPGACRDGGQVSGGAPGRRSRAPAGPDLGSATGANELQTPLAWPFLFRPLPSPARGRGRESARIDPLKYEETLKNRRIELTWIGHSERNGEECALIRYEAFFNRFDMQLGESSIDGLSHYWGLIWVSLTDKQVEHATLNEHVSLRVHGESAPTSHHRVLRVATLRKVATKN